MLQWSQREQLEELVHPLHVGRARGQARPLLPDQNLQVEVHH